MEQVKEKMGVDCLVVYGMTETSGAVTSSVVEDSFELKSATVGFPQPHTEIKIVNPVTGEICRLDESGELLTRGCLNMKGYYNMPEMTAETIDSEGWLHTGDLATMGANGYVKIVGRTKDMIIRGGENLYPAEIEAFLMRHPKIAEAQVIGIPDPCMGEEAAALLRLKPDVTADEAEISEYCRAGISRHKVPRYIRFVVSYPLTSSGKVKKFELRDMLVRDLGLQEAKV
jgi:fatty-acyl-CoA synthase